MIIYTKHFLERIKQRNIDLVSVEEIMTDVEIETVKDDYGNLIKQKNINGYIYIPNLLTFGQVLRR